jgi:hypothetical protein
MAGCAEARSKFYITIFRTLHPAVLSPHWSVLILTENIGVDRDGTAPAMAPCF